MRIIEIVALSNGAHRNQTVTSSIVPPTGWAVMPNNMVATNFPFGEVEAEEINGIMTVTKWIPGVLPDTDLQDNRAAKEAEISKACNEAIIAGIDVETSQGIEHFSLEETDQINLAVALSAVQQGITMYPYHADGKMCRMFTVDEIKAINSEANWHKLYHTTLCNHLLTWVRRAETVVEINSITYSADNLPEDLSANMSLIISSAGV